MPYSECCYNNRSAYCKKQQDQLSHQGKDFMKVGEYDNAIQTPASDTTPLFSIIVPVYNVAPYLAQCIESVLQQTYSNYELILVDDGSTDQSGEICDSYQHLPQVRVLHKPNGGLSDARNYGTQLATGEYILFLDADDLWGDADFLATTAQAIQQHHPDVVIFGHIKQYEDGHQRIVQYQQAPSSYLLSLPETVALGAFNICAWDKAIRRHLLVQHKITFRDKAHSEDAEWCSLIFIHAHHSVVLSTTPYIYRQRLGSISHTLSDHKINSLMHNFQSCLELREQCTEDKKASYDVYLAKILSMLMIALASLPSTTQQKYIPIIHQHLFLLASPMNRHRERIIFFATKCLGTKLTIFLLGRLYRFLNRKAIAESS